MNNHASVKRFYADRSICGEPVMIESEGAGFVRHSDYAALLQQLAERDAEVGRLRNGAEREQLSLLTQLREAERAREEACGLLRKAWRILDIDAPNDKTTDDIAAFLAASGGSHEPR